VDYEIVPAALAVKSMRDNGYKNAAYALAELIDNSIQANAKKIELLIGESYSNVNGRRSELKYIAVLDDGLGMDPENLQISLQFGNGTHLLKETQKGIGKFGMGLPAASISQCKKVEIWSWQDGIQNTKYTYLDLEEITSNVMKEVPKPIKQQIPSLWEKQCNHFGVSGTLIVWSDIDRCHWRKGSTIIKHSETLIGRIYRKFLFDNRVSIRMLTFDIIGEQKPEETYARPNDPLYLMNNTSCPPPFDTDSMFERWGDEDSIKIIKFRDEEHKVILRYSIVKRDVRSIPNAGTKDYGRHAAKNLGVSIMRAEREITLDQSWAIQYETTERWWGVEIEFPPALDEIFGLTNNKQSASFFEDLTLEKLEDIISEGSWTDYKQELMDNNDPSALLIDIVSEINRNISEMRKKIKLYSKGDRSKNKRLTSPTDTPEGNATDGTNQRKEAGYTGKSDKGEQEAPKTRIKVLEDTLKVDGYEPGEAKRIADLLVRNNLKYYFESRSVESSSFFTVRNKAGVLIINLNSDHPAYPNLIELLEQDINGSETIEELGERLQKSRDGLLLLLAAWARFEDEEINEIKLDQLKDIRSDWGKVARGFFRGTI